MKHTIICILIIGIVFVIAYFAGKVAWPAALLLGYVIEYAIEPWIKEIMARPK